MTKTELVERIAKDAGQSQADAKVALESMLGIIVKSLKKSGRFGLIGLGSFDVVKRAKRTGRNPRTGEKVTIKARKAVRFKPSKNLKDAVN